MGGKIQTAILATVIAAAGAATALAAHPRENDATAINQAKITLTQAIAAAEQQTGGRAAKAEFEHSKRHGWVYEVEVVSGSKVFDVTVDSQQGTVLASEPDSSDQDDEDENEHDEER